MSKRVLIPAVALAVLVVVALGIVATFQLIGTKRMLAAGLTTATGREVRVEGPTTLRAGLVPGLLIEGVTMGPAEGSALRSARIGRLELVVALWPLVRGDIEVRRLEIDDAVVLLEPSAAADEAETPDGGGWRYSLQGAEVRNLKLEIQLGLDGAAATPTTANLERLSLNGSGSDPNSLEFDGTLAGAHVTGSGSLDLSPESRSLSLRVHAEAPDLQALSTVLQRDLPAVGPVRASGLVETHGETLGVSDLDLQIGSRDTAWLEVTGSVRDLAEQQGFKLQADFGFDDVRVLAPLVRDPPHIGRVVGKASVHDADGPARVEEFTLKGGRPGVFEVDVEGHFDDVKRLHGLDVKVDLKAHDLTVLGELLHSTLPSVGPLELSGRVTAHEGAYGVSDLDLDIGSRDTAWLKVTGFVRDIAKQQGFKLQADFGFDDVRVLAPLVRDPPHIGRVVGKASVHDADGPARVEEFTLKGGRPGVFEVDVEGHFDDVKRVHGLDAHVDLKARDLAVLGELLDRTLPPTGPVELSGRVTAQDGQLTTDHITAHVDRTHLQGSVTGDFRADARPRIAAQLEVPDLYLDDLGFEPDAESDADSSETANVVAPGTALPGSRLFSDTPVDLAWSRLVDGHLAVRAGRVLGAGGPLLHDVGLDARLENGQLSLQHVVADVQGGSARGALELDSRASPPTLAVTATAEGLNLGDLLKDLDADGAWSGKLDAKMDLKSRGASPRAVTSGLRGEIVLSSRGGTMSSAHAGLLARDLFHSIRSVVGLQNPSEALNCLIVDFEFHEGTANARTLLIDAKDIVIAGEGEVDLRQETMNLRLVPKPRRASVFSTAATVQIKGPLTNPAVRVEKGSLVTSTTEAIVNRIGSVTGIRRVWQKLTGRGSDPSLCETLEDGTP